MNKTNPIEEKIFNIKCKLLTNGEEVERVAALFKRELKAERLRIAREVEKVLKPYRVMDKPNFNEIAQEKCWYQDMPMGTYQLYKDMGFKEGLKLVLQIIGGKKV